MKTTEQPQHCAHVADFYAEKVEMIGRDSGRYLRAFFMANGYKVGGAAQLIQAAQAGVFFAKKAAHEWVNAGGAA